MHTVCLRENHYIVSPIDILETELESLDLPHTNCEKGNPPMDRLDPFPRPSNFKTFLRYLRITLLTSVSYTLVDYKNA